MKKNYVEWSKTKSIRVADDTNRKEFELEYTKYNTLYCRETGKEYWFNNTLVPYAYEGLCLYICECNSIYILETYEVLEVTVLDE